MKEIDYRKYRYLGNENDYSNYRLDNFVITNNKNKKINVTKNNQIPVDITELKEKIEYNIQNGIKENIEKNTYETIDIYNVEDGINCIGNETNILDNYDIISKKNKNTKQIKKSLNIGENYNINLNSKDLENTSIKKKRSYTDLISDSEVEKILNESYPDEDTDTDYCINNNVQFCDNIQVNKSEYTNENKNTNINKQNIINKHKVIDDKRSFTNDKYNYNNSQKNNKNRKYVNSNGRKKPGITGGIVLLLIFVITFCLCNYFIPNSLVYENEEQSLYFVGKYAVDMVDAERLQNSFIIKGGAGNIYKINNKLFVIADMYKTEEIAKSIIEKQVNNSSFDGFIKLNVRKYCYKYISDNLHSAVCSALNYIDVACFDLQNISYNISSKEIDLVEAKDRIKRLSNNVKQIANIFSNSVGNSANSKVLKLKSQLEISYNFLIDLPNQYNLLSKIKETYISIILLHINIIEDSYIK